MKKIGKFIIYIIMSALIIALLFLMAGTNRFRIVAAYIANADEYTAQTATKEIMPCIEKVQTSDSYTKLVVGDSVCGQIFNGFQEYNEDFSLTGSNDAITIPGQYLLITEFLKSHPNATDVYLVTRSFSGNGFQYEPWAYQYLVIPFSEAGLLQNLDDETLNDMGDIFGDIFMIPRVIEEVDQNPILSKIYINSLDGNSYDNNNLTIQYLKKLIDVCDSNGVTFHMVHAPVAMSAEAYVSSERDNILNLISGTDLEAYVTAYYDSTIYYDDSVFSDGIHFNRELYNNDALAEVIRDMSDKIPELSTIKTS